MNSFSHKVSVIIPSTGRDTIRLCQTALDHQTRRADEVIVILDRRGSAWARNEGIKKATGDLIAFIDDDCVPPPDWLEKLIHAIEVHQAAGAGGIYEEVDQLLKNKLQYRKSRDTEPVDSVNAAGASGNVMYKTSWLEALLQEDGFVFNESFRESQDWELAWRLRLRGAKLVFVHAPVKHLRRVTPGQHLRLQFTRGIGIALLFKVQRAIAKGQTAAYPNFFWGGEGKKTRTKWLHAFWLTVIGPFAAKHFPSKKEFFWFWLGEKFKAVGFLVGLSYAVTVPKGIQNQGKE